MFTQHKLCSQIFYETNLNCVPYLEEFKTFWGICKSSEWDEKFRFSLTFHFKKMCICYGFQSALVFSLYFALKVIFLCYDFAFKCNLSAR